jgi:UDP-3-O-[3-hydroxymyristoyl] glucosamine N-acyltransferase
MVADTRERERQAQARTRAAAGDRNAIQRVAPDRGVGRNAAAGFSLGELAERFGCVLQGDPNARVTRVATLPDADAHAIAFVANSKYVHLLAETRAGAVVVSAENAAKCRTSALIARNPYAVYARIANVLHPPAVADPGIHPAAIVDRSAQIAASASIGAGAVIEADARIGPNVVVGPHCVVMRGTTIGAATRLIARVTLCAGVSIGERCILHPGAVVGSDGFGNAPDAGAWVKIPQLGTVRIGNDVEIGANTTIDRGALQDTVIEDGVRLDNLIQVAHNVRIGAHTAIAALVGIAGSTRIGKHCVIAGKVGIADQLEICDHVTILAMTTVGGSIHEPGVYSGALGFEEVGRFRRHAARFRQLDDMAKDLRQLKKAAPPVV